MSKSKGDKMKHVYITGSKNLSAQMNQFSEDLRSEGADISASQEVKSKRMSNDKIIAELFHQIDESDIIYVFSDGFLNAKLKEEINYGHATGKHIFASGQLPHPQNRMISKIMDPPDFIKYVKGFSSQKSPTKYYLLT